MKAPAPAKLTRASRLARAIRGMSLYSWASLLRLCTSLWKRIEIPLLILSLLANVIQILGGPFWPTAPEFLVGPYSFGAPLDASFVVQNRSILFPVRHPKFFCNPISLHTEDNRVNINNGYNVLVGTTAANDDISPNDTAPVRCALSQIHFPGTQLRDAQIRLIIEYDSWIPFRGRVSAVSDVFTLDTKLVPPQWVKGKILR